MKKKNKKVWLVNTRIEGELGSLKGRLENVYVNTVQRSSQYKQLQFLKGDHSFSRTLVFPSLGRQSQEKALFWGRLVRYV